MALFRRFALRLHVLRYAYNVPRLRILAPGIPCHVLLILWRVAVMVNCASERVCVHCQRKINGMI